ncbi:hypothetical protein AWZ03_015458, partial [Drosophila navojoa]
MPSVQRNPRSAEGQFLGLPAEKRVRLVLINKYCANCLAHQHSGQSCRSKAKCITICCTCITICRPAAAPASGPTSSALAGTSTPEQRSRKRRRLQAVSKSTREDTPPLNTLMQHKAVSILPTALISLQTDVKEFD